MFWAEGVMRHGMVGELQEGRGWRSQEVRRAVPEGDRGPLRQSGSYLSATSSGVKHQMCILK